MYNDLPWNIVCSLQSTCTIACIKKSLGLSWQLTRGSSFEVSLHLTRSVKITVFCWPEIVRSRYTFNFLLKTNLKAEHQTYLSISFIALLVIHFYKFENGLPLYGNLEKNLHSKCEGPDWLQILFFSPPKKAIVSRDSRFLDVIHWRHLGHRKYRLLEGTL